MVTHGPAFFVLLGMGQEGKLTLFVLAIREVHSQTLVKSVL